MVSAEGDVTLLSEGERMRGRWVGRLMLGSGRQLLWLTSSGWRDGRVRVMWQGGRLQLEPARVEGVA